MADTENIETSEHHHHHHHHHRHHTPLSEGYHQVLSDTVGGSADAASAGDTAESIGLGEAADGGADGSNGSVSEAGAAGALTGEEFSDELKERMSSLPADGEEIEEEHHHHHHHHHHSSDEPTAEEKEEKEKNRKKLQKDSKKKKITPFKVIIAILIVLLALMIIAAATFFIMRAVGNSGLKKNIVEEETIAVPDEAESEDNGKTVIYKGEKYCYNENNITILCLGTDKSKYDTNSEYIGDNGQSDAIFLAVLDKSTGKLTFVAINRDCICDVEKYNTEGGYVDTEKMQLCLAYAYGDGGASSAENAAKSVSMLLKGIPINGYAAIDYTGVSALNDKIGGVTLEILEDLTFTDSFFEEGKTVTLEGYQAITYIRARGYNVDSATRRLQRQKQYLTQFLKQTLGSVKSNPGLVLSLYQTASDYMVTDISASEVVYMASLAASKGFSGADMQSVPGEVTLGDDGYAEFYPDEEGLYELVLSVFYTKQ